MIAAAIRKKLVSIGVPLEDDRCKRVLKDVMKDMSHTLAAKCHKATQKGLSFDNIVEMVKKEYGDMDRE